MNDIDKQIYYGLDKVDPNATVLVNLKDLIFINQTMQELVSFFHRREHYKSIDSVHKFLGNRNNGAFAAICDSHYNRLWSMMPDSTKKMYENGIFDCPDLPFYKVPNANNE